MKKQIPVTIIIPVRAEEKIILKTLRLIREKVEIPHFIFIADDHVDPNDQTVSVVKNFMKNTNNIKIIEKRAGDEDGFGPALVRAVREVTTPATVFVMADLSDDPIMISKMWSEMKENNVDVVVGCRNMRGAGKTGGPLFQGIFSSLLNIALPLISLIRTKDATNAFKMWRTDRLKEILPRDAEPSLVFSLQLSVLAAKRHLKIIDLPTHWMGRTEGKSKFKIVKSGLPYLKWSLTAIWDRLLS